VSAGKIEASIQGRCFLGAQCDVLTAEPGAGLGLRTSERFGAGSRRLYHLLGMQ